jgi:hypothetical protein
VGCILAIGRSLRGPGDPLFKIFIKIETTLENNIQENMNTSFRSSKICAAVFNIVTAFEVCLADTRKINRSATF